MTRRDGRRHGETAARDEALQALRVLVAHLGRSARSTERRTGVTNAQLFLMQQIAESPGLSVNALADRARTGQNTVSAITGRLVAHGLVTRARAAADRRRVELALTPAGRALVRRAPPAPTAQVITALQRLPGREVRGLASSLRHLVRALGLTGAAPTMLFEHSTGRDEPATTRARSRRPRRGRSASPVAE